MPFAVEPRKTAGGCGCPSGGREATGTGIMPNAWRAGNDATGSWTGIAPLDWYGAYVVGFGAAGETEKVETVGAGTVLP